MVSLADLLPLALLQRPMGGPAFGSLLPKAQSNVTPGSPGGPVVAPDQWSQLLNSITNAGQAGPQSDLHKAQAQKLKTEQEMLRAEMALYPQLFGGAGTGAPPASTFGAFAPPAQGARDLGGGLRAGGALTSDPLALIEKHESGGRNIMQQVVPPEGGYNSSVGRVTGPSTAQGYYQITNATWRDTAPKAGVDLEVYPTAMSAPKEVQAQVAQTLFNERGWKPWVPYNPRLAAAIAQEDAPAGGVSADPGAGVAPIPSGAPGAPSGFPGGINPQTAQAIAWLRSSRGAAVPDFLNKAGGLPFVGAEAEARKGVDLRYLPAEERIKANEALRKYQEERKIGLQFAGPEAQAKASGERAVTEPSDIRIRERQSTLDTARDVAAEEQRRVTQGQAPQQVPANAQITYPPGSAGARAYIDEQLRGNKLPENVVVNPGGSVTVRGSELGPIPPGHQVSRDQSGAVASMPAVPGSPAELEQKEKLRQNALREANKQIAANIVVQDIDRAFKLVDSSFFPATGMGATFASKVPGMAAHDLSKLLDTVKSNAGLDKLQAMREASPTGGALGQVTDRENALLQAAIGSLEQSQTEGQFKTNLQRVKDIYLDTIHGPNGPHRNASASSAPVMKSPEEAAKLPPGTVFQTPDGRTLRVPERK